MPLNLINKTSALVSGLKKLNITPTLPMFGTMNSLNNTTFKYSPTGGVVDTLLISKIDLTRLFANIECSVIGLIQEPNALVTLDDPTKFEDSVLLSEVMFDNQFITTNNTTSEIESVFMLWATLFGIRDLDINEVTISVGNGELYIKADKAKFFTGEVVVKYKEPEPIVVEEDVNQEELQPIEEVNDVQVS